MEIHSGLRRRVCVKLIEQLDFCGVEGIAHYFGTFRFTGSTNLNWGIRKEDIEEITHEINCIDMDCVDHADDDLFGMFEIVLRRSCRQELWIME